MNVILPQNLQRLYHCCQVIYSKAKKEKSTTTYLK